MVRMHLIGLLLIFTVMMQLGCSRNDKHPKPIPAVLGLDKHGRLRLSDQDRCPVCAMRVARHPKSACAMELHDGTIYYFCATGCMIRAWLHPDVFLGLAKKDINRMVVQEYFGGKPIDAMSAVWVAGSDVVGPMGRALIPLEDQEKTQVFIRRHGGEKQFRLSEMNDEKWEDIMGKKPIGQSHE